MMQVARLHTALPSRDRTACASLQGHTYLTYGPLLNGATNVVFEGQPTYPSYSRCWEIVEKYKVAWVFTSSDSPCKCWGCPDPGFCSTISAEQGCLTRQGCLKKLLLLLPAHNQQHGTRPCLCCCFTRPLPDASDQKRRLHLACSAKPSPGLQQ